MAEGELYAATVGGVGAVEALGVDLEQHLHGVSGPFGRGGWWDAAVEPGGYSRVPQVIGRLGKRRRSYLFGEHIGSSVLPRSDDGELGQFRRVALSKEQSSVRCRAEYPDVLKE